MMTGASGLKDGEGEDRSDFALADLLGIRYVGVRGKYEGQATGGYMQFDEHPFFDALPKR